MECKKCKITFSKKSNLTRHERKVHESNEIHHHGLQYVDKQYIKRELFCEIHRGVIKSGKVFHCFACNFSVCADCMEEDCTVCNKDICIHKQIHIYLTY